MGIYLGLAVLGLLLAAWLIPRYLRPAIIYLELTSRPRLKIGAAFDRAPTVCLLRLKAWDGKLREYLAAHQNRLPANPEQNYFFWLKLVKPKTSPQERELLYCPQDNERQYPSSIISDPALAGKDLSLLPEPGRVVPLRELGYPQQGKYAWFITLDGSRHWWTRREDRKALFNPELPGEESFRFYGETNNGMLVWLFLALLTALGYCALNAWAKRR